MNFDIKTMLLNLLLPLIKAKSPAAAKTIEDAQAAYADKKITWEEAKGLIIDAVNTAKDFWKEGAQLCDDFVVIIQVSLPPIEKFVLDIEAFGK